jgi:hypothetical protein
MSDPTVCKRLDLVNELLGNARPDETKAAAVAPNARRQQILEDLENGKITASEAAQLLRAANEPAGSE